MSARLNALNALGQKAVILSGTNASPSYKALIARLQESYPAVEHLAYDAISSGTAVDAFEQMYGERALADYDFSKADLIVSFDADFLGDWQGGSYAKSYVANRVPKQGQMSHHVQLESNMTLTGANADKRLPLTAAEIKRALAALYQVLNGASITDSDTSISRHVKAMAQKLMAEGSKSVVVCGIDDVNAQLLTLAINESLQSQAFDSNAPRYLRSSSADSIQNLIVQMNKGEIGALFIDKVNPVYSLPNGVEFAEAMQKVGFTVCSSFALNETAELASFVAANSHYLESWADAAPKKGYYTITQPVIRNLFDTRQFEECLLKWSGIEGSYHDFIQENWRTNVLQGGFMEYGGSRWCLPNRNISRAQTVNEH